MDCDIKLVPEVYKALKTFYDYCYQPRNLLELKLNEGLFLYQCSLCGVMSTKEVETEVKTL